jgi:hypothetical protein
MLQPPPPKLARGGQRAPCKLRLLLSCSLAIFDTMERALHVHQLPLSILVGV